ncbi:MAG: GTP-dependent dephospho-CoA kinase family protein [Methanoregulaceae archaeon]
MLTLPPEERHLFQKPFGTLFPDIPSAVHLLSGKIVFAVGDVVTKNLLASGIQPALSVVDGYTQRLPCERPEGPFTWVCVAKNPAGTICDPLVTCIERALGKHGALIQVEGEEDLAVIPIVLRAPDGAVLIYGQPNEGVVVRVIDDAARADARRLLFHFVQSPDS